MLQITAGQSLNERTQDKGPAPKRMTLSELVRRGRFYTTAVVVVPNNGLRRTSKVAPHFPFLKEQTSLCVLA